MRHKGLLLTHPIFLTYVSIALASFFSVHLIIIEIFLLESSKRFLRPVSKTGNRLEFPYLSSFLNYTDLPFETHMWAELVPINCVRNLLALLIVFACCCSQCSKANGPPKPVRSLSSSLKERPKRCPYSSTTSIVNSLHRNLNLTSRSSCPGNR